MPKIVYQILDETGTAAGGHSFTAPDQASLDASVKQLILPAGWTKSEVADESLVEDNRPVPPAEIPS